MVDLEGGLFDHECQLEEQDLDSGLLVCCFVFYDSLFAVTSMEGWLKWMSRANHVMCVSRFLNWAFGRDITRF